MGCPSFHDKHMALTEAAKTRPTGAHVSRRRGKKPATWNMEEAGMHIRYEGSNPQPGVLGMREIGSCQIGAYEREVPQQA
jgi:hypothetical protein